MDRMAAGGIDMAAGNLRPAAAPKPDAFEGLLLGRGTAKRFEVIRNHDPRAAAPARTRRRPSANAAANVPGEPDVSVAGEMHATGVCSGRRGPAPGKKAKLRP